MVKAKLCRSGPDLRMPAVGYYRILKSKAQAHVNTILDNVLCKQSTESFNRNYFNRNDKKKSVNVATDMRASHLWGVKEPMVSCTFGGKVYDTLSLNVLICIGNLPGDNAQTTKDS